MGLQTHTFRRGASYVWRKRIPVKAGGGMLQISLRTNDHLIAKRLALIVGAESCGVFDAMEQKGLTRDEARRLLVAVIDREHGKIRARRAFVAEDPSPDALRRHILDDRAAAYALKALADKGLGAAEFGPKEAEPLHAQGFDDQAIGQVIAMIEGMLPAFTQDPRKGLNSPAFTLMREVLGRDDFDALALLEGRKLYLQGRAAALENAATAEEEQRDEPDLMELAEQLRKGGGLSAPPPQPLRTVPQPIQAIHQPIPAPTPIEPHSQSFIEKEDEYDPSLAKLIERLMEQKKRDKMSEQMIGQMSRFYEQFRIASKVTDIRDLRQSHLARFVDLMHQMPAHYNRSPKKRSNSMAEIIKAAPKDAPRLSSTTIDRNLDYITQLLNKARSEGFTNVLMLDVNTLRPRNTKRARDERKGFTAEEIQKIFAHPLFTGNMRKNKWRQPGPHLTKDGVYWVPILVALSGGRREEIAALKPEDVEIINGIAVMHLRENDNRGVKNFSSVRTVPIHPQIIELGFLDHVEKVRARGKGIDLFPDLKSKTKFGKRAYTKLREVIKEQLGYQPKGMVFHSMRHYVSITLRETDSVRESIIEDILGHTASSITRERYAATTPLPKMLEAIKKLPWLPVRMGP